MSPMKLFLRQQMSPTVLIQRLNKPTKSFNPFSFGGGGLPYGGLSKEARDLLKDIFSFDYMGAAQFEHGAVPEALAFLYEEAERDGLTYGEYAKGPVYFICPKPYEAGVRETIDILIKDESHLDLKRFCGLKNRVGNQSQNDPTVGWLEITNGFMFFIDKEMFEKSKKMFGLQ